MNGLVSGRRPRHVTRDGSIACTGGLQRLICLRARRHHLRCANLAAFGLDRRLSALAAASGASYSRYADDLTFSGSGRLLASAKPFRTLVAEIVEDEGFRLNRRKSRLTTRAGRQAVTGIVVNERPNAGRREYDALRATLHDAALRGHAQANRAGLPISEHISSAESAWFEQLNPARAAKLRRAFAEIDW